MGDDGRRSQHGHDCRPLCCSSKTPEMDLYGSRKIMMDKNSWHGVPSCVLQMNMDRAQI